jgi:hypothetical protein
VLFGQQRPQPHPVGRRSHPYFNAIMQRNIKLNKLIILVAAAVLLAGLFPASQAQAFSLKDIFNKIFKQFTIPSEIKITEKGDIVLDGTLSHELTLIKCIWKADINEDGRKECVNPFSAFKLGKSRVKLVDKYGRPDIPRPVWPEDCELRIISSPEKELLTKEERRAFSRACSDFMRIQREAVKIAFEAKQIYNNTDPLSSCLFVRNCKTSCSLSFGRVVYTISALDIIIKLTQPLGWAGFIIKIVNVARKINKIYKIYESIKSLINSGIAFVNGIFKNFAYLSTLYSSLTNLLHVQGVSGFGRLLAHYSDNLLKFSQAKSEAIRTAQDIQNRSNKLAEKFKNIEGVRFLYGSDALSKQKRDKLQNQIITPYLLKLESPAQLFSRLKEGGLPLTPLDVKTAPNQDVFCPSGTYLTGVSSDRSTLRCRYFIQKANPVFYGGNERENTFFKECEGGKFVATSTGTGYKCKESYLTPWNEAGQDIPGVSCPGSKFGRGIHRVPVGNVYYLMCNDLTIQDPPLNFDCQNIGVPGCSIIDDTLPDRPWSCSAKIENGAVVASCDAIASTTVILDNKNPVTNCRQALNSRYSWFNDFHCKTRAHPTNSHACIIDCPKNSWTIPLSGEMGTYKLTWPTMPGEITVNCKGNCTFSCARPNIPAGDTLFSESWFDIMKDMYRDITVIEEIFTPCAATTTEAATLPAQARQLACAKAFGQYRDDFIQRLTRLNLEKLTLSDKNARLPSIPTSSDPSALQPWELPGNKIYWITTPQAINDATSTAAAERKALNTCEYSPSLPYNLWGDKVKALTSAHFLMVKKGLERLPVVSNIVLYNYIKVFLKIPIINNALEEIKEKLQALKSSYSGQVDSISGLQRSIGLIEDDFKKINALWADVTFETISQRTYIEKIIETKNISLDVALAIEDALTYFNNLSGINDPVMKEIESLLFTGPENIRDFVGKFECPDTNNPQGFLGGLRCFEIENNRTFEDILLVIKAIDKLADIVRRLDTVIDKIKEIKPTLDIEALQINGSFDDILSGKISFSGNLLNNPLASLNKIFNDLDDELTQIGNILNSLINTENTHLLRGFTQDKDLIRDLLNDLRLVIFGDDNLRSGCSALGKILTRDPQEIESECAPDNFNLLTGGQTQHQLEQNCQQRYNLLSAADTNNFYIEDVVNDINSGAITNIKSWWLHNVCDSLVPEGYCMLAEYEKPWMEASCVAMGFDECNANYPVCEWEGENTKIAECQDFANNVLNKELFLKITSSEFKQTCSDFEYQKALKLDCESYSRLKHAIQNNCPAGDTICPDLRKAIEKLTTYASGWNNTVPDLTDPANKEQLGEIRRICQYQTVDIRTPLDEVMKVYSVLLGVKSGTLAFKGIKSSVEDAKRIYANAQRIVTMIKKLPEELKKTYDQEDLGTKGGLHLEPPRCLPHPATGWNKTTSARGGQVCPAIGSFFSRIEASFGIIRQMLLHMDFLRREKEAWELKLGDLRLRLLTRYPLYGGGPGNPYYDKVNQLYEAAKNIKQSAQNTWALATAISFANQNFTCGQSICKFPFCISGTPLVLSPLTNPYGYLVFILRRPLLDVARGLENKVQNTGL